MKEYRLGIIGAGNMGHAIAEGAVHAGLLTRAQALLCDRNAEKREQYRAQGYAVTEDVAACFAACDTVLLAVKPQNFDEILPVLAGCAGEKPLVISIAAGVTNMVMDYVLIAVCDLGVAGAAISTTISRYVACTLALLVLFFLVGVMRTCGSFAEMRRPEVALKLFVRFALAKGVVTYGLELMMALFRIVQGMVSTIMDAAGFGSAQETVLPQEIITAVEDCGFFESIPLWAVTLIGGLFITVLSFIMIMSVYGRFFRLYLYTAIAPVPLSTFAGEPTQNVGKSFLKSYAAVCLEGAIIVLACIIFSVFASSPPVVNPDAAAVTMVWSYVGELIFNMLVLVGAVKMADRVVREMMGL